MSQDVSDECETKLGALPGSHIFDTHLGESATHPTESSPVSTGKQSNGEDQIHAESSDSELPPETRKGYRFRCNTCGQRFPTKRRLQQHHLTHKHHCEVCKTSFTTIFSILNHKCTVCDFCGKQFKDVLRHKMKAHSELPIFSCRFCTATSLTHPCLIAHLRTHNNKGHWCQNCNRQFSTAADLNEHLENRFSCETCQRCFKNANLLHMHRFRLVNGKIAKCQLPYSCEVCKEPFEDLFALTSHMRTHKGPAKSYMRVKRKLSERRNTDAVSAKEMKLTGAANTMIAGSSERQNMDIGSAKEIQLIGAAGRITGSCERENTDVVSTKETKLHRIKEKSKMVLNMNPKREIYVKQEPPFNVKEETWYEVPVEEELYEIVKDEMR